MMKILTLNNISSKGLDRLPHDRFEVSSEIQHPDGMLLRSAKIHDMAIPDTLKAVGRAGAGVNNIPIEEMSKRGIAVFNTPGANANAVKELVIAGMFLAARNIVQAWDFGRQLEGSDDAINKATEDGKKDFVGFELPGRTLGVIGLGAIGVKVANAAEALGMNVIGFDPQMTVGNAWELSASVREAHSVDEVFKYADFISLHVPENDHTKGLVNEERLGFAEDGLTILNFARPGIVDEDAVIAGLESGKINSYVCDFPTNAMKKHPKAVALPHIGASTNESQENCAIMAADQVRDFLETGNVKNSVNFPDIYMPRGDKGDRMTVVNANVPNMLGQINTVLANAGLNIDDMYNKAQDDLAYTVVDVEGKITDDVVQQLKGIEGVLSVRVIE